MSSQSLINMSPYSIVQIPKSQSLDSPPPAIHDILALWLKIKPDLGSNSVVAIYCAGKLFHYLKLHFLQLCSRTTLTIVLQGLNDGNNE